MPAVFAVIAGQAMPLFQGAAPEDQITEVLDQLIAVAEQRFGIVGAETGPDEAERRRPRPPPRPATPQELALAAAHDALDAGDLDGAIQAYRNVLADEPANAEAKLGLAQAELLRRVEDADPQKVRQAAADAPADVAAQLAAADLDLVGGHVEDAFGRLVDTVRRTAGEDRDARTAAAAGAVRGDRPGRPAGGVGAHARWPGSCSDSLRRAAVRSALYAAEI